MKKIYLSILSLSAICFLNSCYYDNLKELHPEAAITQNNCDTSGVISYSSQIVPILTANCTQSGCHNGTGSGARNLNDYNETAASATNGNVTGDGGSLYSSITWDGINTTEQMPQGGSKISECDIAKIKKWAAAGAPNN